MKGNLFLWFVFINNKKMRVVKKNKSKTAQTSLYLNGHALASPKGKWFLKILNLLIFNIVKWGKNWTLQNMG